MEDDVVIGRVGGMAMGVPVGRTEMELYIADPFHSGDGDMGIEEIGACITIEVADTMDGERLPVGGG